MTRGLAKRQQTFAMEFSNRCCNERGRGWSQLISPTEISTVSFLFGAPPPNLRLPLQTLLQRLLFLSLHTVTHHTSKSHKSNVRVPNPRIMAYLGLRMPFKSSKALGSGPVFPDSNVENRPLREIECVRTPAEAALDRRRPADEGHRNSELAPPPAHRGGGVRGLQLRFLVHLRCRRYCFQQGGVPDLPYSQATKVKWGPFDETLVSIFEEAKSLSRPSYVQTLCYLFEKGIRPFLLFAQV